MNSCVWSGQVIRPDSEVRYWGEIWVHASQLSRSVHVSSELNLKFKLKTRTKQQIGDDALAGAGTERAVVPSGFAKGRRTSGAAAASPGPVAGGGGGAVAAV